MGDMVMKFPVDGDDYQNAGAASSKAKNVLKKIGIPPMVVRKVGICMYEGEINMVIHADGGTIIMTVGDEQITLVLDDRGPGIPDISLAMKEGYSTANSDARNIGFGAGMGLPNMKKNSDDMKIETEIGVGTRITMVIRI